MPNTLSLVATPEGLGALRAWKIRHGLELKELNTNLFIDIHAHLRPSLLAEIFWKLSIQVVPGRMEWWLSCHRFKGLIATNEWQDNGSGILHQVTQFPIDQVYLYTRHPCLRRPHKTQMPPVRENWTIFWQETLKKCLPRNVFNGFSTGHLA